MSLLMTFRIAFKALGRNKLRTALTMLGMIIGVAAVIAMVALGNGAKAMIEEQVRATGTNLITITPGSANMGGVRGGGGTSTRIVVHGADGHVVSATSTATPNGPDAVLDHLVARIDAAIRRHEAPIDHVGVGFPGRVSADGTVSMALNLGIDGPLPRLSCQHARTSMRSGSVTTR